MSDILVFDPARRHNGDLIRDAAQLGWLPEPVFDATYGKGKFWTEYQPRDLVTNDLYKPANFSHDYREPFPVDIHGLFGTVIFDPDYKYQGTGSETFADMNASYGMDRDKTAGQRTADIVGGAVNCAALVAPKGFLLVKCMDQIVCGSFKSQTKAVTDALEAMPGWKFESWLHLPMKSVRPQRSQRKPRNNYSTLLAFKRRK